MTRTLCRRPGCCAVGLWAVLISLSLHASADPPAVQVTGDTAALFDQVWEAFESTYPYFEHKGIDWLAFRDRYRPSFEIDLEPQTFAFVLATALRELRDQHVWVRGPDGNYVPVYAPGFERNFTSSPRNRYTTSPYERLGDAVWHAWLTGGVGYVRIDTFESAAFSGIDDAAIEGLFARYGGANGLIIDVRPNAGGDETVAAAFAGHFTDTPRNYGFFQFRDGAGFGPVQAKTLLPAGGTLFSGPTVVLIGDRNMSSAEWFVLMMASCPQVTLVGDATRGSSGNPAWLELANGVDVAVPRWIAYRPDMVPLEGSGIEPAIAIAPDASFDGAHDYVVERAFEVLTSE